MTRIETDAFGAGVSGHKRAINASRHTIDDEIAEGDNVVNRWTMKRKLHSEMIGIPTAGKGVIQSGVTIFHLSKARIDEFWSLTDNPELMQQLGAIPPGAA